VATFVGFLSIPAYTGIIQNILDLTSHGDPLMQSVIAITLTLTAFGKDLKHATALDMLNIDFLESLLTAWNRYRNYIFNPKPDGSDNWIRFMKEWMKALSGNKLASASKTQPELYSNLAASFVTYVHLGQHGWNIYGVPAAAYWSNPNASDNKVTKNVTISFVHMVAQKTYVFQTYSQKITGIFHIEAFLSSSDKEMDKLVKSIVELATTFDNLLRQLGIPIGPNLGYDWWLREIGLAIIIVIYDSDPGAGEKLVDELSKQQSRFRVPVYVVWVDENGIVRGSCVGPRCDNNVLQALAKEIFGVGLGQQWTPPPTPELHIDDNMILRIPEAPEL
jgi:hypothetical protein